MDALNEAARQNAALAARGSFMLTPGQVALGVAVVLVAGTAVFLAVRSAPAPRANPSRSSRKSKPIQKMGRKLERKIARIFG